MSRIECVTGWRGPALPPSHGPQTDLIVLDLDRLPALAALAAWVQQAQVPVLVAGREPVDGYRVAVMMSGHGTLAGWQAQTHRSVVGDPPAVRDEIIVFDVDGTRLSALVGQDVAVPEVARAVALMGAELLVAVATDEADLSPYGPLWRAVQANQTVGLSVDPPRLYVPCEAEPNVPPGSVETLGPWVRFTVPWGPVLRLRQQRPLLAGLNAEAYLASSWLKASSAWD
jgi:hypothetical protein